MDSKAIANIIKGNQGSYNLENTEKHTMMHREILWSTQLNGSKYSLSIAHDDEIDDVCEIVNADKMLEVWHLFRLPVYSVLQKNLQDIARFKRRNKQGVNKYHGNKQGIHQHNLSHGMTTYSLYKTSNSEEQIIGMGGIVPLSSMGNTVAEVWFIGSDMKQDFEFVAHFSREILESLFEKYSILTNVVGTWNKAYIRWLRYLGFFVEKKPQYVGVNQALFYRFYMTKEMFYAKYF